MLMMAFQIIAQVADLKIWPNRLTASLIQKIWLIFGVLQENLHQDENRENNCSWNLKVQTTGTGDRHQILHHDYLFMSLGNASDVLNVKPNLLSN